MNAKCYVILTLVCLWGTPFNSHAETYAYDTKSTADLKVFKAGMASAFAHDHIIRADRLTGSFEYIGGAKPFLSGFAKLAVRALIVDQPSARRAHGLSHMLSAGDRKAVKENMLSEEQLDVTNYALMEFRANGITRRKTQAAAGMESKAGQDFLLKGALTIRGVTRQIEMPIMITSSSRTVIIAGRYHFKQSDFGMKPYSAMLGAVRNKDKVELVINLIGHSKSPAEPPPATSKRPERTN